MPFAWPTAAAIFITIWWVVLFAVLPLGVRSQHEGGEPLPPGSDPGAPTAPRLVWKAALTTVLSAVLFALLVVFARFAAA